MSVVYRSVFLLLLLLLPGLSAWAQSLYQVDVPLADRGPKATAVAIRDAFESLLVRLTGTRRVLQNPMLQQAAGEAENYLLQYSYREQIANPRPDQGVGTPLYLNAVFQQGAIDRLVRQSGEALLPPNRPMTLFWIMVDEPGGRYGLTPDSNPELAAWLGYEMAQHALPLQYPSYDVIDMFRFPPELIWGMETGVARAAARRYDASSVVLGRMARLGDGRWLAEWQNLVGEAEFNADMETDDPAALMRRLATDTADAVASRFAIRVDPNTAASTLVVVEGIDNLRDFRKVQDLLGGLGSVQSAQPRDINGSTSSFRLFGVAGTDAIVRELALIRELNPEEPADDGALRFVWGELQ